MTNTSAWDNMTFEAIAKRIKASDLPRKIKEEMWILTRRGDHALRKTYLEFQDFVDQNPHIAEWLKTSAIVGGALELIPLSRVALWMLPGFVPGAAAGFMKGQKTGSCAQSAVIGGLVSWPVKPMIIISPIAGMLLVAFVSGYLEEILAESADRSQSHSGEKQQGALRENQFRNQADETV